MPFWTVQLLRSKKIKCTTNNNNKKACLKLKKQILRHLLIFITNLKSIFFLLLDVEWASYNIGIFLCTRCAGNKLLTLFVFFPF